MIASGDWWRLEEDGALYIYCVGDMSNYEFMEDAPWFANRDSIESVDVADSVTSIGSNAFGNAGFTSISIGRGVTKIESCAFVLCYNLTSVTIPDNVTSIGNTIFRQCYALESVTIGVGVANISDNAFGHAHSLTSINVDSQNQTYASSGGVLVNKSMTELIRCPEGKTGAYSTPDSVTSIRFCAFEDCDELTSVIIGGNVTSIGAFAFHECDNLASVTIPASVTAIGDDAFLYTNLHDVYYAGTQEQWNAITIGEENDALTSANIHYNYVPPLSSIAVTTPPTKTAYLSGETFDPDGMIITATYSDDSTAAVTGYAVSPSGSLTTSDRVITVSYAEGGVTAMASVSITVRRVPDLKLIFNGVDFSDRLSTYRVSYETNFRKVVTALNGTEYFGNGTRRPIITFTLFPMTDAQAKAVYDALKVMVSSCTYTDKATNTDRTAKFRVTSSLEYVFGLRSVDGNRYYKGGEIVLRGVTCLA